MAYFTPLREETLADQALYLEGRLVEVDCLDCLATVRVKKNSEYHTSIQWSSQAAALCSEFAKRDSQGRGAVRESCPRLRASIDSAVREGRLTWEHPDA
jgi:hypothetical protein